MKEKRYFCDLIFAINNKAFGIIVSLLIVLYLAPIIPISILYKNAYVSTPEYERAMNSYSASTYEYLDEIANNVIKEGVCIDLLAIPDDVVNYEIYGKDNEIIFKYCLDNNKDIPYAVSANMAIKLSNDLNIISKEPNYSSEKAYVNSINSIFNTYAFLDAFLTWTVFCIIASIIVVICILISKAHKNKNIS